MPKPFSLALFVLLGLGAVAASAADVSVRQFMGQVQPVLNPQLSAWVSAQSAAANRSAGPVNTASLRASAAAALGSRKATPENVEVLLSLVLAAVLQDALQDIQQIAQEIERNVALKQSLRDIAAQARKATVPDIFTANPTLMSERQSELDAIRKALAELLGSSGDVTSDLAFALQVAVTRTSQAMQQLAAMLVAYSRAADTIIGNIRG